MERTGGGGDESLAALLYTRAAQELRKQKTHGFRTKRLQVWPFPCATEWTYAQTGALKVFPEHVKTTFYKRLGPKIGGPRNEKSPKYSTHLSAGTIKTSPGLRRPTLEPQNSPRSCISMRIRREKAVAARRAQVGSLCSATLPRVPQL